MRFGEIIVVVALLLAGCSGRNDATPGPDVPVGAWVAGKPIEYEELKRLIRIYLAERGMDVPTDEMLYRQITFNVLQDIAETEVLLKESEKRGLSQNISDNELDGLSDFSEDLPSGFESLSEDRSIWKERIKRRIELIGIAAEISNELSEGISITDEQLLEEYRNHIDTYVEAPHFELRMIRVKDRELAMTIRKNILKGWSFQKLAEQYSTLRDDGAGGRIVHLTALELPPAFAPEIESLPEGRISPVLATDEGFFIFRIEKRFPERTLPFEDVRDSIYDNVLSRERSMRYRNWMQARVAAMNIQIGTPIPAKEFQNEDNR